MTKQTVTVKFQFMKPFVTGRRFIHKCGELGRHKLRQRGFARTREGFDGFQIH
jgi:hypothetical protein